MAAGAPPSMANPTQAVVPGSGPQSTQDASPAPAESSPQVESASRDVIQIVQKLRGIASNFPGTAPQIQQINDLLRKVQMTMMANAQPGESAAPPV